MILGDSVNALTEVEKAYLAGLIDGEGCFYIAKQTMRETVTFTYTAQLIITMTCQEVLERIRAITGAGALYFSPSRSEKLAHQYRWVVTNRSDLGRLIRDLLPHFIVKLAEAELVLKFLSVPHQQGYGPRSKPKWILNQEEHYYTTLMGLKTRGKGPSFIPETPEPLIDPQMRLFE